MSRTSTREEALFADALAQPPAQRGSFLAQACGADAALLARIAALIAAHEGPESLLSPSPSKPAPAGTSSARPDLIGKVWAKVDLSAVGMAKAEEKPGDTIGRYKLLQKIGEGGCGVVWMAEQEEPVRRRVALKVIKLGMDTRAVVARFEAERQALAMMDHPCIAKVHDAGSTDTGRPFFVMELVRGIPITKYCDENHLTPKERLELFIKVCQAIQHAHQKGVIHRDIKPSNILVTVNDGAPTPKVIDFGIAKATQGKLTDATVFTAFEQFIGTPVYMSPEQAEMSSLDIDTRSDIYSLGVLLYELLTGKPPFDPKVFAQAGVDQIRQQIREIEPPRPSARLRTLDDDERTTIARLRGTAESQLSIALRGDLDWIVMRCIEKDRTRRYNTANGLAMDIQRYLRNEPVVARPPSTVYLLQKVIRRHRLAFAAGAAVVAALLVGLTFAAISFVRERAARERALMAEALERQGRQRAEMAEATARQAELKMRRQAYAADMNLAREALANDDLGRVRQLLARHRPAAGEPDLRGWEWRYLWQHRNPDPHTVLTRNAGQVVSLSISADGNWVAIGGFQAGEAIVHHLRTKQEHRIPLGEVGRVDVAFSPVAPLLAVGGPGPDKDARPPRRVVLLWNLEQQREERRLILPEDTTNFTSQHFSLDGQDLVTSSFGPGNIVEQWNVSDGGRKHAFDLVQPRSAGGLTVAFAVSPDLQLAAHQVADDWREIRVIELERGAELWRASAAEERVGAMAFSPDGSMLATGGTYAEPTIRLWDVRSGAEIGRLHGHRLWVSALVFFPDGRVLASASGDGTIRLWDLTTRTAIRTLRGGHEREVLSLALHRDGATLLSGGRDGTVVSWDTRVRAPIPGATSFPARFINWQFTADSKAIRTLDQDGAVGEWKGAGFQEKDAFFTVPDLGSDLALDSGGIRRPNYLVQFSRDARFVAVGSLTGNLRVWDVARRSMWREFKSTAPYQLPVAFLDNNTRLLVCEESIGHFREYDLVSGREIASWAGPALTSGFGAAVTPDEQLVLTIGTGGNALYRNRLTEAIERFDLAIAGADAPQFSPNGRYFSAGSRSASPRIWETSTRREVAELTGSVQFVGVAFSPDGSRLAASGTGVDAIRIWDLASYQPLLTLPAQGSLLRPVRFSPDGNIVGAVSSVGTLHIWRAPSWEEIEAAEKAQAVRNP